MNQTESQQQGTDLRLMLAQADALCAERRFEEAAAIYQQLVGIAESRFGPEHPDSVLVVQRLADSLYAMNLFRDCLPLYERLCQIARGMLGDGDPDVIGLMFKIAKTQELIGSFQEARATYEYAIGSASRNLPPGHELTSQLEGRLEVLVERMDENKRAAQAWKENTVNTPAINIPPAQQQQQQAQQPHAQQPPPLQTPPGMQQMPPEIMQSAGPPPQSMIGQLPPHLMTASSPAPWQEEHSLPPMPAGPQSVPAGNPFDMAAAGGPPGIPFDVQPASPSVQHPFSEPSQPAHPSGNPFGEPPAMADPFGRSATGNPLDGGQPHSQASPPWGGPPQGSAPIPRQPAPPVNGPSPWESSPAGPNPSSPWSAPPGSPPPAGNGAPPDPWGASSTSAPSNFPPAPQSVLPPAPQSAPPAMQAMPQQPPQSFQSAPPAPQSAPPVPQSIMPQPGSGPSPWQSSPSVPSGPPQDPWSSSATPSQPGGADPWASSAVSGAIGAQLMQQINSERPSPQQSFAEPSPYNAPPNSIPVRDNGNSSSPWNQSQSSAGPPSGFPPSPEVQSPFASGPGGSRSVDLGGPPSMPGGPPSNEFSRPSEGGGVFEGGGSGSFRGSSVQGLGQSSAGIKGGLPVNDPFADTGRKSKPDPYLEHLAAKVADLKAQAQGIEMEHDPGLPSAFRPGGGDPKGSGWHDAIGVPAEPRAMSQEIRRNGSPVVLEDATAYDDVGDGYDYDQGVYEPKPPSATKVRTSRAAATKSEDLVSNVRAFKEYLIPVVVLLIVVIGGYFFITTTTARPPATPAEAVVAPNQQSDEKKVVYATPDNSMRLALGTRDCAFVDGTTLMNVPCAIYDGGWSTAAMQLVDSIMERQIWFNHTPEGLVTDTGTILFEQNAPEGNVMKAMNGMAIAANGYFLRGVGYPTKAQQIQTQVFVYANPFTGVTDLVKLQNIPETRSNRTEIMGSLQNGALLLGEEKFSKGEVRAYGISENAAGTEKGLGFFVRGADRNGNFFKVRDTGQTVTLGFLEGKDVSNCKIQVDMQTTLTTPTKPTKVWIAKNQNLPIFVIYHSLPISMAILAFLCFWRSLMVAPGQDPDNAVNRTFRICSYVAIALCLITAGIQYAMWM